MEPLAIVTGAGMDGVKPNIRANNRPLYLDVSEADFLFFGGEYDLVRDGEVLCRFSPLEIFSESRIKVGALPFLMADPEDEIWWADLSKEPKREEAVDWRGSCEVPMAENRIRSVERLIQADTAPNGLILEFHDALRRHHERTGE